MSEHSPNPSFLHHKFRDLNTSPEVEAVVKRETGDIDDPAAKQTRTKELIPQKPEARIQAYLDYLQECLSTEDPRKREEKLSRFKQVLHEKYVTKSKDIPESYWTSIRRRHHEEGHGEKDRCGQVPRGAQERPHRDIARQRRRTHLCAVRSQR